MTNRSKLAFQAAFAVNLHSKTRLKGICSEKKPPKTHYHVPETFKGDSRAPSTGSPWAVHGDPRAGSVEWRRPAEEGGGGKLLQPAGTLCAV